MSNSKKYFWLKLKDDFFTTREVKKLRKIAGGDTYTVIYLKLQLLSIKREGLLVYEGTENNLVEQLALELDEDEDNVRVTLSFLEQNKLIEQLSQDEYLLSKVPESIGSETGAAERMRKMRENRNNVTPQLQGVTESYTEIEKEIEKDKRIERKSDRKEVDAFFESIWKAYPEKKGKSQVSLSTKRKLMQVGEDTLLKCIKGYEEDLRVNSWKKPMHGSTFFNGRYEDYLQVEEKPEIKFLNIGDDDDAL
jgi:predicted phage replisome organizer